ncbi:unnamed protein product [Candidula unifasciata]|uniref:G-protein coupled receptors family 1 profile domain-containing protein n=1 Tax=Candidula unifasciata TaxID=100452 RepID=A0A8S3ZH34_9EUPU|nr:unnamed protein product [Candidula unifasciata]
MSFNASLYSSDEDLHFEQAFKDAQIGIILMYAVTCIIAVVGNTCAVYVVVSRRRMRNVTNYFIASLAISDILMAVICIPFSLVANVLFNYWPFGAALCPIVTYLQVAVVFQNAYTMLAMSLERYIAIMHPFMVRLGKKRCLQIVTLCWVLAFLTPIPTAATSRVEIPEGHNDTYICMEIWDTDKQRFSYSVTIMILQYFVPLVVLIYTYSQIVRVIWLKEMPTPGELLSHAEPGHKPKDKEADPRKKVIKMMITVVGIYSICWLPLHAITIASDVDDSIFIPRYMRVVWIAAHWLAMSSCAYNPFIYWWMNPKFRDGYISILHSLRSMVFFLCDIGRGRKESAASFGNRRFFSRFGNGSGNNLSSRRHSSTQMVEFTGSFCDGPRRCETAMLTDQQIKEKPIVKDAEYLPELSKISEVTENGTSSYGIKANQSYIDDKLEHEFRT